MAEQGCKQRNHSRHGAFTLLELLVVIAIISLLAAILFPVFSRARENARRASCSSNLKEIGLAVIQYSQDFDENMPSREENGVGNWEDTLQPYVRNYKVFVCPSNLNSGTAMADNITSPAVISYGCNTDKPSSPGPIGLGAFSDLGEAPIPVSSFVNVAGTIMICEVNTSASDFNITDGYFIPAGGWQTGTAGSSLYSGHLSTGNYLFCDGHVKALRPMATISVVMGGSGSVNMWDRKNQDYVSGYQYDNALAILTQAAKVYS